MPAYIPGITNRTIRGLQIGARGITNKGGDEGISNKNKKITNWGKKN